MISFFIVLILLVLALLMIGLFVFESFGRPGWSEEAKQAEIFPAWLRDAIFPDPKTEDPSEPLEDTEDGEVRTFILEGEQDSDISSRYRVKRYFHTKSEMNFHRYLKSFLSPQYYSIFSNVRLADVFECVPKSETKQADFNKISSKHMDFVIVSAKNAQPLLLIELDGVSHNSLSQHQSDQFKDELASQLDISLIRVTSRDEYPDSLKILIQKELTKV